MGPRKKVALASINSRDSDPSNSKKSFFCFIFDNMPFYLQNHIIRSVDYKLSTLTFKILIYFHVDPYPKYPNPPSKM